jgi:hypothetical protein
MSRPTPTDRIRKRVREQVHNQCERFLEHATNEEIWFLLDTLSTWESIRGGVPGQHCWLAEAFADALGEQIGASPDGGRSA